LWFDAARGIVIQTLKRKIATESLNTRSTEGFRAQDFSGFPHNRAAIYQDFSTD
jgi:hypothetical protein